MNLQPVSTSALTADRREVKAIIKIRHKAELTLADYHDIGKHVTSLSEDKKITGIVSWCERLATLVDYSKASLNKTKRFFTLYPDGISELDEQGYSWDQVSNALPIEDPDKRLSLLQKAKAEGLNGKEIQRMVQQQAKKPPRGGGRPPRKQRRQGLFVDLGRLKSLTLEWSRFRQEVWAGGAASYLKEVGKVPSSSMGGLSELLKDAATNLETLLEECQLTLEEVKGLAKAAATTTRSDKK